MDSKTKTPILVCGLLAADVIFNVDTIPADAVKYRADRFALRCGGGGCYAAVAINRLGGSSAVMANVGDDHFGSFILSTLDSQGIDRSNVKVDPQIHTPISSISIDSTGERQIVNYRDQSPTAVPSHLKISPSPAAVLVDARWIEGSVFSLEYAKAHKIPGVVDAEAPVSKDAMELATHIAFSKQGLSQFALTDSIADGLLKAASQFSAWVCVTDGENGTHILNGKQVECVPAPNIDAVDTLGAGDVWHGAFTLQLALGVDEINAVKFANTAAALKCTHNGGGWSAPDLKEVNQFLGVADV